jgi:hypothetical protein
MSFAHKKPQAEERLIACTQERPGNREANKMESVRCPRMGVREFKLRGANPSADLVFGTDAGTTRER